MRRQNMYRQWTWDFKLSDTCKNASLKNSKKEVKEVPVRVFIYSELHLHSTQSTFWVWYSFRMHKKWDDWSIPDTQDRYLEFSFS